MVKKKTSMKKKGGTETQDRLWNTVYGDDVLTKQKEKNNKISENNKNLSYLSSKETNEKMDKLHKKISKKKVDLNNNLEKTKKDIEQTRIHLNKIQFDKDKKMKEDKLNIKQEKIKKKDALFQTELKNKQEKIKERKNLDKKLEGMSLKQPIHSQKKLFGRQIEKSSKTQPKKPSKTQPKKPTTNKITEVKRINLPTNTSIISTKIKKITLPKPTTQSLNKLIINKPKTNTTPLPYKKPTMLGRNTPLPPQKQRNHKQQESWLPSLW